MGGGFENKPGGSSLVQSAVSSGTSDTPGKRTLTEQLPPAPVQRRSDGTGGQGENPSAASPGPSPGVTPPRAGINKAGFVDNGGGANIRTGPAESGGQTVRVQPLPPATRVFVSGTHPDASAWWYVTAYLTPVLA